MNLYKGTVSVFDDKYAVAYPSQVTASSWQQACRIATRNAIKTWKGNGRRRDPRQVHVTLVKIGKVQKEG